MHIVHTIGINLDRGIECAGRLGKVDASPLILGLHFTRRLQLLACLGIVIATTGCQVLLQSLGSIVPDELVHVFNQLESPAVTSVNFILRIHANRLAVNLTEMFRGGKVLPLVGGRIVRVIIIFGTSRGETEEACRGTTAAALVLSLLFAPVILGGRAINCGSSGGGGVLGSINIGSTIQCEFNIAILLLLLCITILFLVISIIHQSLLLFLITTKVRTTATTIATCSRG